MAKGKLWIILLIAAILLVVFSVVYMKKTQPLEDLTRRYDYLTRLTHSGNNYGGSVWSPDGERIAYLSYSGDFGWLGDENKNYKDSSKIWVMNVDGSDKQLLLSIPFPYRIIIGDFYWIPDGSKLVFGWIPNKQFTSSDICLIDVPATAKKETS